MSYVVSSGGEVNVTPEPNDDDRRRAALLAGGGHFDKSAEDMFAEGIAVARSGGDVQEFIRAYVEKHKKGAK